MITNVKKQNIDGKLVSYKVTLSDERIISVPLDEDNIDYKAIQDWLEADEINNKIEEAD